MKHTATPWKNNDNSNGIHTKQGNCIATTHNGEMRHKDAQFIVKAANNFEPSIELLQKFTDRGIQNFSGKGWGQSLGEEYPELFEEAEQLLTKINQ